MGVCGTDADGLFRHGGGHGVFGGLVVVGEGDEGCGSSEHGARRYLAVSVLHVGILEVGGIECNKGILLFKAVEVLDKSSLL